MKNNRLLKSILAVTIAMYPLTTYAATTKKETVFTNLNTDGTVVDTTVTNYICPATLEKYEDQTKLNEIVNLNGSETFTQDGDKITWKVEGKDIYYQGNTNEEQPLDISIKYFLNDKELSSDEIRGKSGNVKIKINLENKMKNRVKVNGKYETLYTPFVVMAGTIIDSDNNTNINATNGRVVNTGDKNIVASIASPGLYESINLSKLNNLDNIEFSFDTTNFKMDNIYIIATPKLLEEKDIKLFKDLDKVTDSIKTLQDSMNQIQDGSSQLKNGTDELLNGVNLISSKLPTEESNKANEQKLEYLKGTNESTIEKLTIANKGLEAQVKEVEGKITYTEQQLNLVKTKKSAVDGEVKDAEDAYNLYSSKLTSLKSIPATVDDATIAYLTEGKITSKLQLTTTIKNLETTVPLLKNQYDALVGTQDALQGTVDSLEGTLTLLKQTKSSLQTSIEANKGLIQLIGGNNQVVNSSLNTIDSMRTLSGAMNQLNGGIRKLNTGATTLNNGITKFNKEGINKLSNYSIKVNNYSSKAEALVNLSKNYKGYASTNATETIFVNKVQSIK